MNVGEKDKVVGVATLAKDEGAPKEDGAAEEAAPVQMSAEEVEEPKEEPKP
jgi:hypothetical protein